MTKIGARVSTFVLASLWMASAGFAQVGNSYILPGITSNDNLTIGNLNPQATTATIAFYDSSGKLSSLTVELGAGSQTRVNPTTVALTSFIGSIVVSGPLPLTVSADRFEGSTAFDFIYASEASSDLVIPFLPSGASVDVNMFNPGPNQAQVKVVLMQTSGAHTEARTATIDPLHTTTINIPSSSSVSYAFIVTGNLLRPDSVVAANAVIRNFAQERPARYRGRTSLSSAQFREIASLRHQPCRFSHRVRIIFPSYRWTTSRVRNKRFRSRRRSWTAPRCPGQVIQHPSSCRLTVQRVKICRHCLARRRRLFSRERSA